MGRDTKDASLTNAKDVTETPKKKNQWHPAFVAATELELRENKRDLTYEDEHQLSKKPLSMDLLVIRQNPNVRIKNEIGHIFRGHNIWEFKSPDDNLSIDDFFKTMGYACLYKASGPYTNSIPADEVTFSLLRERFPRKLMQELRRLGAEIRETQKGIYQVGCRIPFASQIIVSKQLDPEKHNALRVLSKKAKIGDVRRFLQESSKLTDKDDRENAEAITLVSAAANLTVYKKVKEDKEMNDAMKEFLKDWIEEENERAERAEAALQKAEKEIQETRNALQASETARQQTEENLRSANEKATNDLITHIRNLTKTMGLGVKQAMDALLISPEDQGKLAGMI